MIRLDRWLVTLGIGSRSQLQKAIRAGQVSVNGQMERDPGKQCNEKADVIAMGGKVLDGRLQRHVIMHKPAGILTAARDKKQPTVMDLLPPVYASIGCMPVGRLDKDTTGLLFFTTDGEMNHRLLSPGRHVDKRYVAHVDGPLDDTHSQAFAQGLNLGDFVADSADLTILSSSPDGAVAAVVVHEGKFHQIKRMFEAVGRTVVQLHRTDFGPLTLPDDLKEGTWRQVTPCELKLLYQAAQMQVPESDSNQLEVFQQE